MDALPLHFEIVRDKNQLFADSKHVNFIDQTKQEGCKAEEITQLRINELKNKGSCLVIVSTKKWARKLFELGSAVVEKYAVFHLSTS